MLDLCSLFHLEKSFDFAIQLAVAARQNNLAENIYALGEKRKLQRDAVGGSRSRSVVFNYGNTNVDTLAGEDSENSDIQMAPVSTPSKMLAERMKKTKVEKADQKEDDGKMPLVIPLPTDPTGRNKCGNICT